MRPGAPSVEGRRLLLRAVQRLEAAIERNPHRDSAFAGQLDAAGDAQGGLAMKPVRGELGWCRLSTFTPGTRKKGIRARLDTLLGED